MNALQFLRLRVIGYVDGRPVMSRRSYRGFLIALLAGRRTVVLNATLSGGAVLNAGPGAVLAGNSFPG